MPESCLDSGMTEWERGREREEFSRAAAFYKTSSSILSSRFTPAKLEDDTDKVDVPRDEEVRPKLLQKLLEPGWFAVILGAPIPFKILSKKKA